MLVDDDSLFNIINEKIMQITRFSERIDTYVQPKDALTFLKNALLLNYAEFPDVMFIDVNMPHMDGWQFLDRLNEFPKSALSKCRIYMLTSSIDQSDIEKAEGYSIVSALISKPLTVERLEKILAEKPKHQLEMSV
jgi:CheY-like chemotaxis protein